MTYSQAYLELNAYWASFIASQKMFLLTGDSDFFEQSVLYHEITSEAFENLHADLTEQEAEIIAQFMEETTLELAEAYKDRISEEFLESLEGYKKRHE